MSDPTPGPDPRPRWEVPPEDRPDWGAPQPPSPDPGPADAAGQPPAGYGPASPWPGAPAGQAPAGVPGRRPGQVTAAAVIGIVWGALGTLAGLVFLGVAFELSAALGLINLLALGLSVALLVGGIHVLTGRHPGLVLLASYVTIGVNLLAYVVSLIQGGGSPFNGILGIIVPGVIVFLLRQPQAREHFAARGIRY